MTPCQKKLTGTLLFNNLFLNLTERVARMGSRFWSCEIKVRDDSS